MAHLTYFETLEEYNSYVASEDFVKPNISYCEDSGVVYYTPNIKPSMSAVFTIGEDDSLTVKVADSTDGILLMKIDDTILDKPVSNYTFEESGEHTVEYQFKNRNVIPDGVFNSTNNLKSVNMSGITSIGDYNFYCCFDLESIGTDELDANIGNNVLYNVKINDITDLTINGNVGNSGLRFDQSNSTVSAITINGNIGDSNINGNNTLIKKVIINGNVGNSNFGGSNIQDLYVDGNFGNSNLGGVNTLTALTINGDVGSANYFYFNNTDTVHFGGNVQYFNQISGVTNIIVDGNLEQFYGASGCTNLTVSGSVGNGCLNNSYIQNVTVVGNINSGSFYGCYNLQTANVGGTINSGCFYNCNSLESITVGGTVINSSSLYNNPSMTSITLTAEEEITIGNGVFAGTNNCPIYCNCSALSASFAPFYDRIVTPSGESCKQDEWVFDTGTTVCDNYVQYYGEVRRVSLDGGETWTVVDSRPSSTPTGEICPVINLNNQWSASTKPVPAEGYSVYESYSNVGINNSMAEMQIKINGYSDFSFKVRNYSESCCDFVVVLNLDDVTTRSSWSSSPTVGNGTYSNGYVYYSNKSKSSSTTWYDVTFSNISSGEHTIRIIYGKDSSAREGDDKGYVAIPD